MTWVELSTSIRIRVCTLYQQTDAKQRLIVNLSCRIGCACDIPSALYSYSFAPNPNWTMLMPPYKEIKNYVDTVVDAYNLRNKITFSAEVYRSTWQEDKRTWLLYLRDVKTGCEFTHECQILFPPSVSCWSLVPVISPALHLSRVPFSTPQNGTMMWT